MTVEGRVTCRQPEDFSQDAAAIVVVFVLSLVLLLVFLGTSLDLALRMNRMEAVSGPVSHVGLRPRRHSSGLSRLGSSFYHRWQRIGSGKGKEEALSRRYTIGYKPSIIRRISNSFVGKYAATDPDPSTEEKTPGENEISREETSGGDAEVIVRSLSTKSSHGLPTTEVAGMATLTMMRKLSPGGRDPGLTAGAQGGTAQTLVNAPQRQSNGVLPQAVEGSTTNPQPELVRAPSVQTPLATDQSVAFNAHAGEVCIKMSNNNDHNVLPQSECDKSTITTHGQNNENFRDCEERRVEDCEKSSETEEDKEPGSSKNTSSQCKKPEGNTNTLNGKADSSIHCTLPRISEQVEEETDREKTGTGVEEKSGISNEATNEKIPASSTTKAEIAEEHASSSSTGHKDASTTGRLESHNEPHPEESAQKSPALLESSSAGSGTARGEEQSGITDQRAAECCGKQEPETVSKQTVETVDSQPAEPTGARTLETTESNESQAPEAASKQTQKTTESKQTQQSSGEEISETTSKQVLETTEQQSQQTPETTGQQSQTPETTGQQSQTPETTGQQSQTPETTGQQSQTPETTGQQSQTPETTGQQSQTPETTGQQSQTPETTGQQSQTPEATGQQSQQTPETTGQQSQTPEATGQQSQTPEATGQQSQQTPETTGQQSQTPETTGQQSQTPETTGKQSQTPETTGQQSQTPEAISESTGTHTFHSTETDPASNIIPLVTTEDVAPHTEPNHQNSQTTRSPHESPPPSKPHHQQPLPSSPSSSSSSSPINERCHSSPKLLRFQDDDKGTNPPAFPPHVTHSPNLDILQPHSPSLTPRRTRLLSIPEEAAEERTPSSTSLHYRKTGCKSLPVNNNDDDYKDEEVDDGRVRWRRYRHRSDESEMDASTKDVEGGKRKTDEEEEERHSLLAEVLLCFSFLRSVRKVVGEGNADHLFSLNGVRVLSICWIVLGNTMAMLHKHSVLANKVDTAKLAQTTWFQAVMNGTFAADTFFILSGCLVCYHFLRAKTKQLQEKPGTRVFSVKAVLLFYCHRLMRILPCYYVVLLTYTAVLPYLGSGPYWGGTGDPATRQCRDHWWANALFFSNFYQPRDMCMSWSYYLVNDIQMYLLSPLVLYPLLCLPQLGLVLLVLLVALQIVMTALLTEDCHGNLLSLSADFFADVYAKPYCRVGAFAIGVGLGYFLHSTRRQIFFRKIPLIAGWLTSLGVVGTVVYVTRQGPEGGGGEVEGGWSVTQCGLYQAFSRPVWCLAVSFIIFVCSIGQGGFVYRLLSWNAFLPLCRITYGVYLLHPVLITVVLSGSRYPLYLTFGTLVYQFVSNLACAYGLAFFLITMVEAPFTGLEALLRARFS